MKLKKIICSDVFLLIIFSILFFSNLTIEANNNEGFGSKSFVKEYYTKLNKNYIKNQTNTLCTFQSFINFLSFWDTYWNPYFIDDIYNVKEEISDNTSPGIAINNYLLPIDDYGNIDYEEYYNILYENDSFLYEIVSIACGDSFSSNDYSIIDGSYYSFEEFIDEIMGGYYELITNNSYNNIDISNINSNSDFNVYSSVDIDINDFSSTYNYYEYYRQQVINLLNQGYPVIVVLGEENHEKHMCVCYEYNENSNKIYAHTDAFDSNTNTYSLYSHYDIDSFGNGNGVYISDYYAITPKNIESHLCYGNYYKKSLQQDLTYIYDYYCGYHFANHNHNYYTTRSLHICSICDYEGKHNGIDSYPYISCDNYSCKFYCDLCMNFIVVPHEFRASGACSVCIKCNKKIIGTNPPVINKNEDEIKE